MQDRQLVPLVLKTHVAALIWPWNTTSRLSGSYRLLIGYREYARAYGEYNAL